MCMLQIGNAVQCTRCLLQPVKYVLRSDTQPYLLNNTMQEQIVLEGEKSYCRTRSLLKY